VRPPSVRVKAYWELRITFSTNARTLRASSAFLQTGERITPDRKTNAAEARVLRQCSPVGIAIHFLKKTSIALSTPFFEQADVAQRKLHVDDENRSRYTDLL